MRTVRLLTLGLRMFSVFVATSASGSVVGSFGARSSESDAASGVRATRSHRRDGCLPLDELRLVLAAAEGSPRHELHARLDDEHVAESLTDRFGERVVRWCAARELDRHRQGRLLLHAGCRRLDEDVPADGGSERRHHLPDGRREDVDAADDQHVVGAPDAADARARATARAPGRPDANVVARAEAHERRRAVAQVRQHELARRTVLPCERGARLGVDQLRVDEAARAEVHSGLLLALPPQRCADVADPHRLRHPRAPALLELRAERRLASAGLAGDEDALDARRSTSRSAAHSTSCAAYDGVRTTAWASSCSIASTRRSVWPVPTGMWQ